jgi:hypothetical protein
MLALEILQVKPSLRLLCGGNLGCHKWQLRQKRKNQTDVSLVIGGDDGVCSMVFRFDCGFLGVAGVFECLCVVQVYVILGLMEYGFCGSTFFQLLTS